jgi:hypothetical protein
MSDLEAKEFRSKRLHKEDSHIKKQLKIAKSHGLTNGMNDKLAKEPHRLAKHHAMDCGNPECPMCSNPRKLFSEETIQEKSFKQRKLHDETDQFDPAT